MLLVRCSDGCEVDLLVLQYCIPRCVYDCNCDEMLGAVEFDLPHDGGGESVRVL